MLNVRSLANNLSLGQLSGLYTALIILLCGTIIVTLQYLQLRQQWVEQSATEQQRSLQQLAISLIPMMLVDDRISINLALNEWPHPPGITGIRLDNQKQQTIAEFGRFDADTLLNEFVVQQDKQQLGRLLVNRSQREAQLKANRYLAASMVLVALLSGIASLISYLIAANVSRYLQQLRQQLTHWQGGDQLQAPDGSPTSMDFVNLHRTLGEMAESDAKKRAMESALGQYMSSQNASQTRLQYYQCAMVYLEIQDLHILQTRLTAEQLTDTLNHYHQLLSQAAKLYDGRVDRYLGDGIVMIFGVPGTPTNACLHGLHAAQLFVGLTQYLREHNPELPQIEFNIAAHYGSVLMAPLQDNQQGPQCNLIGDTVHWAAQLSQHAVEHRILVSHEVIAHIDAKLPFRWSEGPLVTDLHGRQQAAFWLDSLPASTNTLIQRQIKHITSMTENA